MLSLSKHCETDIEEFFVSSGIPRRVVQRGMHLTVYYARRFLPGGPNNRIQPISIELDVKETRFMVLAPGGENPRPELVPSKRSVGIRLTRRNIAVPHIQKLRREMSSRETPRIIGRRTPSTAKYSCFGARRYQPHIKLLRPGSEIDRDMTELGKAFRNHFSVLKFDIHRIRTSIRRRTRK